jgi:hypothetical protein
MTLSPYAIILIPCALLLVVLGLVTLNRYIAYKERVALARLGFSLEDLNRDAAAKRQGQRGVLWGGVMTAMSGLALLLGLSTLGMGAWLIGGLLPLFVGLGMVFIYFNTSGAAPDPTVQHDAPHGENGAEVSPFVTQSKDAPNDGPNAG